MLQPENRNKVWKQGEERVKTILKEKLDLENVSIKQANPLKKKRHRASQWSRIIVCKLQSDKHNNKMLKKAKKLKGSNIFINEGLSYENRGYRKELWKRVFIWTWCLTDQWRLNWSFMVLIFSKPSKKDNILLVPPKWKTDNHAIVRAESITFLGVIPGKNLKWKPHIKYIENKLQKN